MVPLCTALKVDACYLKTFGKWKHNTNINSLTDSQSSDQTPGITAS